MVCPCEFPSSIPWSCVRDLIRIIRTGAISEWSTAVRCAACIAGSCANIATSDGPFGTAAERPLLAVCDELEGYLDDTGCAGIADSYLVQVLMELVAGLFGWLKGE